MNGKVLLENDDLSGISVVLSCGGYTRNLDVSQAGIFTTELDWNKVYYFKISKPGFVSKIVEFSTFIPDGRSRNIEPFYMSVRLFPVFDGVDTVFFKKPVAKVFYDETLNDFTDDRDYALKVVYHIKQMKEKTGSKVRRVKKVPEAIQRDKQPQDEKKRHSEVLLSSETSVEKKAESPNEASASKEADNGISRHACNLPPMKDSYPAGRTVETFSIDGKKITRVVIKNGEKQDVFFMVKHPWGGVFYFIDETPLGVFSVTETSFMRYTNLSRKDQKTAGTK